MEVNKKDKKKLIFKVCYYLTTVVVLGLSAKALYTAYLYLNIRRLYWACLGLFLAVYLVAALIYVYKNRGFRRFVTHSLLLQLIPICATIFLFSFISARKDYRPIAGATNVYERSFNDLQATQKAAAVKNGLSPFTSRAEVDDKFKKLRREGKLVHISTNSRYVVQPLSYSVPYVVPKVEELLEDLGESFQAKTESKAKFIVTSVLRTEEDVKKLQGKNGNATTNSCHCNATTIDISYVRFNDDCVKPRSTYELRLALAKTLHEFRKAGRCYVKIEKKQYCYHITVR